MSWGEIFLGVIAVATLTMAMIQVAVIVYGWSVARRVNKLLANVEREIKPLADNVNAIARDAARISSLTAGQIERVDRLVTDVTVRIDQTATAIQDTILRPLRDGAALLAGAKAAIEMLREITRRPAPERRSDEDDSLFVG